MKADLEQKITDGLNLHNNATESLDDRVYHLLLIGEEDENPRAALVSCTTDGALTVLVSDDNDDLEQSLQFSVDDPDMSLVECIEDSFLMHADEQWRVRLW